MISLLDIKSKNVVEMAITEFITCAMIANESLIWPALDCLFMS